MKDVTLAKIAAETGFSIKHVSRALAGSGRVSKASGELIRQKAQALNYRKNLRQTGRVAVICNFYFHWVERLIDELARQGLQGVFWRSQYLDTLPENLFDSAIGVCTRDMLGDDWYKKFNIPLVLIHDSGIYSESISSVSGDFDADMALAVKRLSELGHRRIVWCREKYHYSGRRFVARGLNGFLNTARECGIAEYVKVSDFVDIKELKYKLEQALQEKYTAFVVNIYSDFQWLVDFFKARDLQIAQDISLIVYDSNCSAGSGEVPLSSFELAYDKINHLGVQMLQNMHSSATRKLAVPSTFTDRGSIGEVKV